MSQRAFLKKRPWHCRYARIYLRQGRSTPSRRKFPSAFSSRADKVILEFIRGLAPVPTLFRPEFCLVASFRFLMSRRASGKCKIWSRERERRERKDDDAARGSGKRRKSCLVCDATRVVFSPSIATKERVNWMKGRSGRKERGSERTKRRNGEKRRTGDSQDEREKEMLSESARKKRREKERQELKKEGGRSGSPALLALRWLKAKESARPRTRPGRDLLPSSFLRPALSLRYRRSPASRGILRVSPFFSVLRRVPRSDTQTIASCTRAATFQSLLLRGRFFVQRCNARDMRNE